MLEPIAIFSSFKKSEGIFNSKGAEGARRLFSESLVHYVSSSVSCRWRVIACFERRSEEAAVGM